MIASSTRHPRYTWISIYQNCINLNVNVDVISISLISLLIGINRYLLFHIIGAYIWQLTVAISQFASTNDCARKMCISQLHLVVAQGWAEAHPQHTIFRISSGAAGLPDGNYTGIRVFVGSSWFQSYISGSSDEGSDNHLPIKPYCSLLICPFYIFG